MSSREFAEWRVYAAQEPIGEKRGDLRIATVATLLAESNRDRKKRRKPFRIAEFLELFQGGTLTPDPSPRGRGESEDKRAALWANLKAWATRGE